MSRTPCSSSQDIQMDVFDHPGLQVTAGRGGGSHPSRARPPGTAAGLFPQAAAGVKAGEVCARVKGSSACVKGSSVHACKGCVCKGEQCVCKVCVSRAPLYSGAGVGDRRI